jgi:hypothetical protein
VDVKVTKARFHSLLTELVTAVFGAQPHHSDKKHKSSEHLPLATSLFCNADACCGAASGALLGPRPAVSQTVKGFDVYLY